MVERTRALFMVETGEAMLRAHYADVRLIDASTTMEATADEIRNYVANSVAHRDLADLVPRVRRDDPDHRVDGDLRRLKRRVARRPRGCRPR